MDKQTHYSNYPLIGERFEDVDPRNEGRVVHVLSFATRNGYEIPGEYQVEVIAAPLAPETVGHNYKVKGSTLESPHRYRKVSR